MTERWQHVVVLLDKIRRVRRNANLNPSNKFKIAVYTLINLHSCCLHVAGFELTTTDKVARGSAPELNPLLICQTLTYQIFTLPQWADIDGPSNSYACKKYSKNTQLQASLDHFWKGRDEPRLNFPCSRLILDNVLILLVPREILWALQKESLLRPSLCEWQKIKIWSVYQWPKVF